MLVIPDVHLKPWMFSKADQILKDQPVDRIVCLGDLVDDWDCEYNVDLYRKTLDAARQFNHDHPETFWCYGNHDMAYLWNEYCSGTSFDAGVRYTVQEGLLNLYHEASGNHGVVLQMDQVLFSHAGISDQFVREHSEKALRENPEKGIRRINEMGPEDLWNDGSPLWLRPQKEITGYQVKMYQEESIFQVVGHTPVKHITQEGRLLTCDVFSTLRNHKPYGSQEFCLFDTETWEWKGIREQ